MSDSLRELAEETVEIVRRGWYQAAGGGQVRVGGDIASAVASTRLYLPDDEVGPAAGDIRFAGAPPVVEVTGETTLAAARRLGAGVACLVFASARKPGGGFLSGAQAQEESLARASALAACQNAAAEFYAYHRAQGDVRYSDRVIYSPDVPVFRDDDGTLLAKPFAVSFLTAAAPNLGALRAAGRPEPAAGISGILRHRAERVLRVAAAHGHRRLVLGAWGCGVFGNDPQVVAAIFADLLPAAPWFDHVAFAVCDSRPGAPAYRAFADILAAA